MIRSRVKAGIARAKAAGKHCGRPPLAPELVERIREALAIQPSWHSGVIAKQFDVSPMTVQNVAKPVARMVVPCRAPAGAGIGRS